MLRVGFFHELVGVGCWRRRQEHRQEVRSRLAEDWPHFRVVRPQRTMRKRGYLILSTSNVRGGCERSCPGFGPDRGNLAAADRESQQALAAGRRTKDAQTLGPALTARATVALAAGRRGEAEELASEVLHYDPAVALLTLTVPTHRSQNALAFGARIGVKRIPAPSERNTSSKERVNLVSRSWIRKRGC